MYDSDVTELSNVSNGRPPRQVSDWRSGCAVVQNSPQFRFIVLFARYHSILTLYIYNKSNLIIKRKRAPSLTHKITHITQQVTWQSCYEGTDSNLWFPFRCLSPSLVLFCNSRTCNVPSVTSQRGLTAVPRLVEHGDHNLGIYKIKILFMAAVDAALVIPPCDHEVEADTNRNYFVKPFRRARDSDINVIQGITFPCHHSTRSSSVFCQQKSSSGLK